MDFVSTFLITMSAPSGFWETILNWFLGANGTYILAVILVAICVRFLFSFVDVINKRLNLKNSEINSKMQPELQAVQQKYANDKATLQQKTNEIYKKYQFNMVGSCLPMLIVMVLQLVVFLTLWNALQSVSNYNIVSQYQEMKEIYANVIALNEDDDFLASVDSLGDFLEGDSLSIVLVEEDSEKTLNVYKTSSGSSKSVLIYSTVYDAETYSQAENSNQTVAALIEKYVVLQSDEEAESETGTENENNQNNQNGNSQSLQNVQFAVSAQQSASSQTLLSAAIQKAAEEAASEYYLSTQEGFLWIKNVYKSDTTTSPLFTESEIKNYMSGFYSESEQALEDENDYEGTIFACVVAGIDTDSLGVNGYYLLPIIAILVSVLATWLNNFLMRKKDQPKQKQSWMMYIVMPIIYAIFTLMYTSLFAIYLVVGQIMLLILSPLTTFIVRKWNEHDEKKKAQKTVVEVDYRRKDI